MLQKGLPTSIGLALVLALLAAGLPACSTSQPAAAQQITLNVVTAGDTNMQDLQRDEFGPEFVKKYPYMTIQVAGTGPGDEGSAAIHARLKAQKDSGAKTWDVDVAIVHQSIMQQMIQDGLLDRYASSTAVAQFLTSPGARNALGTDVEGYVIPLFHSQTALAYNPDRVPAPPNSYAELVEWIKAHPYRFGYNGVKNGMSGVAFTGGWLYFKSNQYDRLVKGPYDQSIEVNWNQVFQELHALPTAITAGNNDTLEQLQRGEIDMGPVWVDMVVQWKNQGTLDAKMRLKLIEPGMPGQPMYVVIPAQAANHAVATRFAEFITSPVQQARIIVEKQGWYPGIDPTQVLPNVSAEAKARLFGDIPAETLNRLGLSFPIAPYMKDFQSAYEQVGGRK